MSKCIIISSIFFSTIIYAQQPPRWQATNECNQVKELSANIAEIKNSGATKNDIRTIKSMASDGSGIMGDLSLILFDMHKKGSSPKKFSFNMYERCMRSNGY